MNTPNVQPNEGVLNSAAKGAPKHGCRRGLLFKLSALGLIVVSALAGTGLARLLRPGGHDGPPSANGLTLPDKLEQAFSAWDEQKPDMVLLLSGEQHGYLLPCGCSEPQVGGLERRYNLVRLLKARGWKVVAVDLGDLAQKEGIQGLVKLPNHQGVPKYITSMKSLQAMGYTAVGLGEYEASLTFGNILSLFALNETRPRVVAANLVQGEGLIADLEFKPWVEGIEVDAKEPGSLPIKVGVTSVIGKHLMPKLKERDRSLQFEDATSALQRVLTEMKAAGAELRIMLYQGHINSAQPGEKAQDAVACAQYFPDFQVLLCLSDTDLPPSLVQEVPHQGKSATTQIISMGHKGKHVGVLGVWRIKNADPPFKFKYQLVELTPDFATPKDKEKSNAILEQMEQYTKDLKDHDYLSKYFPTKHVLQVMAPVAGLKNPGDKSEPTYIGSEKCKKCHQYAYDIWKDTPHSHAYQALVDAKRPSNRQFDAECIVCHTVGFGFQGGFQSAGKTPNLKDVGCESCHGPGSLHAENKDNKEWQKRMSLGWWKDPAKPLNPAEESVRQGKIDLFLCQKCHDSDNDVTWINGAFAGKWKKIDHSAP
jgi:2',3'-cyclic-nucleotide 2'-phosphodiesterase (5'-nucleotidase family)